VADDYLTPEQLREALKNAGGAGARTAAELPTERLAEHIGDAVTQVLGRLARDWTVVPADSVDPPFPPMLRGIMVAIAGYTATLEFYGSQQVEDRDPIVLKYARATALLEQIATGKIAVPGVVDHSGGAVTGDPAIYQATPDLRLTDEAPLVGDRPGWYGQGGWQGGGIVWG